MPPDLIQIGGGGPAGLAVAITLAKAGCRVLAHEVQREVGHDLFVDPGHQPPGAD